ncbi:unnamed protein product [Closterium sp. NIES-54]
MFDKFVSILAHPPIVWGASALDSDVLMERQFELAFLAAAALHSCAMLLAPEGDLDALDIPTPRAYAEAAFEWIAAMDAEMTSWRSTGTYTDAV